MDTLKLSLVRKKIRVELESDDGSVVYFLNELTGKSRDTYLGALSKKVKYDSAGKPAGLTSFDGLTSKLLSLSLVNEEGDAVSISDIDAFPAGTQQTLFEASQELSGLNQEAADELGKD